MKETIVDSLKKIEAEWNVKILYACESGSRAWGFSSRDSDYDVRFIYVHHKDEYLTIDPIGIGAKRDVIELPLHNRLDISGWELTKALRLLRKSNPPLMEWLHASIIYYQTFSTIGQMQELSKSVFAANACLHHYLNMASSNFRNYLQGEEVKGKIYFYALRSVLAAKWIESFNEFPPLEFPMLSATLLPEGELKNEINILLKRKAAGEVLDREPKIQIINHFLNEEINRLRNFANTLTIAPPNHTAKLDFLFRRTLEEVWAE